MTEHDPIAFTRGIATRLASRSRHVCLFLGAGVAKACGLPDIASLESAVLSGLNEGAAEAFRTQLEGRNLEQALSRLRRIAALVEGNEEIDGLTAEAAQELDSRVCEEIVSALDVEAADLDPMLLFAAWAKRADYHAPVEVFTPNYDLLIESALEDQKATYFDGFVGALEARFHTELVEEWAEDSWVKLPASFIRLWKIHGSVNWKWTEGPPRQIVRLGHPVPEEQPAAIYPSDTKYEESRRVPFVILQDRFRRALHHPETYVLISGYSFSDEHLNELIFDAVSRRQRTEVVAFCHETIPPVLATQAGRNPNLQAVTTFEAVLGGVRAPWKEVEQASADIWGSGKFLLADFKRLARYLARSAQREGEPDPDLKATLARLLAASEAEEAGSQPSREESGEND